MYSPFQLARKYARYYWQAHNGRGHGVHSPFVFDFIKNVLNDHTIYAEYAAIETIRKTLLLRKDRIEVEDFGAGSTVIKTRQRAIDKMAASSLKPKKFAQLLYRMVRYYQPQTIAELGTSFGTTTAYLASGKPNAQVYTLEGSAAIHAVAAQNFAQLHLQNITQVLGNFASTFPNLLQQVPQTDFVFIDGNHRQAPTVAYYHAFLKNSTAQTIMVFDDIHWSAGMEAAWQEIKDDAAVTLTIDLFFIGLVFFRKDFKVKQHFSIRF